MGVDQTVLSGGGRYAVLLYVLVRAARGFDVQGWASELAKGKSGQGGGGNDSDGGADFAGRGGGGGVAGGDRSEWGALEGSRGLPVKATGRGRSPACEVFQFF